MTKNSPQSNTNVRENIKKFIVKYGALYTGIVAFISDVLQPLFQFTLLFLIFSWFILMGEIILGFYTSTAKGKDLYKKLFELTGGYWLKPILYATILAFSILFLMFWLNDNTKNGFLAEHSEMIRVLQKDLGLINRHLAEISQNTKKTAEHLGHIEKEIGTLKKETSDDPRKELHNLGIPWNEYSYRTAILENDVRVLKLFWAAGMDPYYCGNPQEHTTLWKPVCPIIFHTIAYDNPDWRKLVKPFIDNGKMDLRKDKLQPFSQMFISFPTTQGFLGQRINYQEHLKDQTFTPGQILFCQGIKFNLDADSKLFAELISNGADKRQLLDALPIFQDALRAEIAYVKRGGSQNPEWDLRQMNGALKYLSRLSAHLQ